MRSITYRQLEAVLRDYGFHSPNPNITRPKSQIDLAIHRVFWHEPSGALVTFPVFQPGEAVLPRHLLTTRVILDDFRIADPLAFDEKLRQAG